MLVFRKSWRAFQMDEPVEAEKKLFSLNISYRISCNKRTRRLLNFESVRCGAY